MRYWILSFALSFCLLVSASETTCVRNYLSGGYNPCESDTKNWAYLYNTDPDALFETCTRRHPDVYCEMSNAFIRVPSKPNGSLACVPHYDLEGTKPCETQPKSYSYVKTLVED